MVLSKLQFSLFFSLNQIFSLVEHSLSGRAQSPYKAPRLLLLGCSQAVSLGCCVYLLASPPAWPMSWDTAGLSTGNRAFCSWEMAWGTLWVHRGCWWCRSPSWCTSCPLTPVANEWETALYRRKAPLQRTGREKFMWRLLYPRMCLVFPVPFSWLAFPPASLWWVSWEADFFGLRQALPLFLVSGWVWLTGGTSGDLIMGGEWVLGNFCLQLPFCWVAIHWFCLSVKSHFNSCYNYSFFLGV